MTQNQNTILLDVRTYEEFIEGNVPGSINIPLDQLSTRLDSLPQQASIAVVCASGARAMVAQQLLRQHGFTNVVCLGSWIDVLKKSI